jgi:hypothetical protein
LAKGAACFFQPSTINWTLSAILLTTIFVLSVALQAGFLEVICSNPNEPDFDSTHNWGFDFNNQSVWLEETYDHLGTDSVYVSGKTDEDPDLTMTKAVTNSNGTVWTAYSLTLGGNATFVSASSNLFSNVSVSDSYVLFDGGSVGSGQTLEMSFVVNVPVIGDFSFCLTQLAIPEPASLTLLGLGALALYRRK